MRNYEKALNELSRIEKENQDLRSLLENRNLEMLNEEENYEEPSVRISRKGSDYQSEQDSEYLDSY